MSASIVPLVIAMLGTGGTLAALIIGLFAWLRADMRRMEDRLTARITSVENRLTAVEHSQAKLEGLMDGLREAIVARAAA